MSCHLIKTFLKTRLGNVIKQAFAAFITYTV